MRHLTWKFRFVLCGLAAMVAAAAPALGQQPGTLVGTFTTKWPDNTIVNHTIQVANRLCTSPNGEFCAANPFASLGPGKPIILTEPPGVYTFVHAGGAQNYPCFAIPCSLGLSVVVDGPNNPSLCGSISSTLGDNLKCVHAGG